MRKSQLRLAVLAMVGVVVLGACNNFKVFQSTDDKQITTNIQAKLFNESVLKTRDIHVDTRNGIVTLSGSVGTDLERSAVERIAHDAPGVRNVVDLLSVPYPQDATSAQPVPPVQNVQETPPPAPKAPALRSVTLPPPSPVTSNPAPPEMHAHLNPLRGPTPAVASKPSNPSNASADLEAYTNSVAADPEVTPNPAPAPTVAPPASTSASSPASPTSQVAAAAAVSAPPPAPSPSAAVPPAAAPKPAKHLTVPSGTVVTVRMIDNIDSSRNQTGEEFVATVDEPITVDGRVLAERGADARVKLIDAKSAGRMEGRSELQVELISVTMNGVAYPTTSGYFEQHGASRGTRTAETVGGGAVLGALIGGILGHGKGAAIGSVAGAGAGTAAQVSTKGQQVKIPSETKLDFTLKDPVDVTVSTGQ